MPFALSFSLSSCTSIVFIACILTWAALHIRGLVSVHKNSSAKSGSLSQELNRKPGIWSPSEYERPTAPPYPDWSVHTTKPLPYRPFKYGPKYPLTMGLRQMPMNEWIELDNQFPKYYAEKSQRIADLGGKIAQTVPEGLDGAYELLEEFRDYLPQRYPSLYKKTAVGIDNLLTGERFNTVERPLKRDPMQMAAKMVQDDLVMMVERADGQYYLAGGAVCMRGLWCLEERLGLPLSKIHIDLGKVPHFKEKLEKGVMNLFRRIQPENAVQRNTWYIIGDDAINREGFTLGAGENNEPVDNFYFKTERQTVRRLPRSGAVAFHFRTYTVPIIDIVKEPYAPGRLASAIRSWDDEMAKYKARHTFEGLLKYLDEKHNEQVADGLDLTKEDEVHAYPY